MDAAGVALGAACAECGYADGDAGPAAGRVAETWVDVCAPPA